MRCKEALNCRLTLSHAVLSKGDLEHPIVAPIHLFPTSISIQRENFSCLPKEKKQKVGLPSTEAKLLAHAPPLSPKRLLQAPPSPAGGWRSGEITWEPREAPRGTTILSLSLEVAPLPAGPPGLLPPSAPARVPGPSGSGAQPQQHAALSSRPGVTQAETT